MARLLFFGRLSDIAGAAEREIALPPQITSLRALKDLLAAEDSQLGFALAHPSVRTAINKALAPLRGDAPIADKDEIAFMPPVSGG
jgi:molybdopterin converting factor subunit 1